MNEEYLSRIKKAQNEDAKMQVFSEIIVENTLKSKNIEYTKDKKINGNKDVDFQVNYDNWTYNIEIKTPGFTRRLNTDILYYSVDYRIDKFDHNLIKTEVIPNLYNKTSDNIKYKEYSILTREDYRLEEYLEQMKNKINKAEHTTNVLFIPLYDSQHLCEYFKLLSDTNSLINSILNDREYEDIHIIILGCFIKKIKDSLYNDELCLDTEINFCLKAVISREDS